MSDKPYSWPKSTGLLTARLLRDYASWLFPQLDLEWESPGVLRRQKPLGQRKAIKPYQFRKSTGVLTVQGDLRPFASHVMVKLGPWSNRMPFLPRRKVGLALVADLRAFAGHLEMVLKKKKEEQSKIKKS